MNNKTLISVIAIMAFAGLIGWYMYLQNTRYAVTGTQRGIAYEIDRKTGDSWTIYPGKRVKNTGDDQEGDTEKYKAFPVEEQIKVTGSANLGYGSLSGKLYNGSSWTVKEIMVNAKAIEKDGKTRWNRQFRDLVTIAPLTTESFSIKTVDDSDISSFQWSLVQVNGIPPK